MVSDTISHYRIIEKLGQGGMGEVYRAEDSHLHRHVAIKVLPDEFAGDAERLARFQREAEVLASLNHPNIAAIHGLEESDGKRFIIMEFVEGETLAWRLAKGALPIEESLQICQKIAEGLEAAHARGIVHRDLKPANIGMTLEGTIKILDFGIARACPEVAAEDRTHSQTLTGATTPGVVLGTAAYMSPEQAKGKVVDKRADIWAFGCILYECLTGKRAFDAETATESMARVLMGEPDWQSLPAATPWRIRSLLRRCLRKDPAERVHDIADARLELGEARSEPLVAETMPARRPTRAWFVAAVLSVLLCGAAAALVTWHVRPKPSLPIVRSVLRIGDGQWLEGRRWTTEHPTRTAMALSSDGRFVVYSAIRENPGPGAEPQIYMRTMDRMEPTPLAGGERGISPFLSPDNAWVGFWADGKLKKMPVGGGMPVTLCDAATLFGADWGADNTIVFSTHETLGLLRVSSDGGSPEVLTVPEKAREESTHRLPHFLPDGRTLMFTIMGHPHDIRCRLALLDLKTRQWHVVMEDAADGRCLSTGQLVFLRQGTLMAVAFDLGRQEVRGQPVPAVANVFQALNITDSRLNTAAGQYSVSGAGSLIYAPGGILPDRANSLVRLDQRGNVQPAVDFTAPFFAPRFSSDGRRIAYQTLGRERQAWVYDLDRGTTSRVTTDGRVMYVTWTPDGNRLVFGWSKSGRSNLFWQPVDMSLPIERLTASESAQFPGSFTPDGATLAFVQSNLETSGDILLLDMKSRRVMPLLNSRADEGWPEISPNGRWLAYVSDESGRREVWVRPFPSPAGRWQISRDGGSEPIWSKDGNRLFYRQSGQVWVADIRTEKGFAAGKPRLILEQRGLGSGNPIRGWDLWPDGLGFLMMKLDESSRRPVTELVLVLNWFEELNRLVPTR